MICRICGKKENAYDYSKHGKNYPYHNNFCTECWATTGAKTVNRIYIELVNDLAVKLNQEFSKIEQEFRREKRDCGV